MLNCLCSELNKNIRQRQEDPWSSLSSKFKASQMDELGVQWEILTQKWKVESKLRRCLIPTSEILMQQISAPTQTHKQTTYTHTHTDVECNERLKKKNT